MDAQKNPVPGAAADGQTEQNEVKVDLSGGQVDAGVPNSPVDQQPSADAASPTTFQPDPSMQVTDPSTPVTTDPYAPSPVTDMQADPAAPVDPAVAVSPAQPDAAADLAQVATANAGVEAPVVPETSEAPSPDQQLAQPVAPDDQQPVPSVSDPVAPAPVDPAAVPPVAPTPTPHNDKKMVIALAAVAVVLLAAIAVLYVM